MAIYETNKAKIAASVLVRLICSLFTPSLPPLFLGGQTFDNWASNDGNAWRPLHHCRLSTSQILLQTIGVSGNRSAIWLVTRAQIAAEKIGPAKLLTIAGSRGNYELCSCALLGAFQPDKILARAVSTPLSLFTGVDQRGILTHFHRADELNAKLWYQGGWDGHIVLSTQYVSDKSLQ